MASSNLSVFKLFHSIDRELYSLLVMNLWREPLESMQVLALWLWLERVGYRSFVKKILSLPSFLINDIADETIICLNCITNDRFTYDNIDIPHLRSLTGKEISLEHLYNNRLDAVQGVAKTINEVCIRAFHDIMRQAIERNTTKISFASQTNTSSSSVSQLFSTIQKTELNPQDHAILPYTQKTIGVPPEDRTMFVTFSKGFPVHEWEVREFLTRSYGDCIESLHMQEGVDFHKQALFARIVFHSSKTIQVILNGMDKAKFHINGKHVWARKFVPKHPKPSFPSPSLPAYGFSFPH